MKYLLFVGGNDDHEETVSCFERSFDSAGEAMDYYDQKWGADHWRGGIVCSFDGDNWRKVYRTSGIYPTGSRECRPGWIDYDDPYYARDR